MSATKKQPTYPLALIQEMIGQHRIRFTTKAFSDSAQMGLEFDDVIQVLSALKSMDFYKTMPSENRPELFQDVYRPNTKWGQVYLKLQIDGDAVLISFKYR